ncbi:hypothetical protein [Pseudobutyrivibrio sp. MD2005]|uniref:hypothetical protein n=1 Tax=Pseudobutyrivibrio sp. MD2005 TaxID=1410616 RepID=UPI000A72B153|nr:hypothetical protein [Pseudobutyrivibrio sp. MD2005]
MRIKDFIETLSQYDENIELVINVDGKFITPSVNREVVHFKHEYTGTSYKDSAVVLAK